MLKKLNAVLLATACVYCVVPHALAQEETELQQIVVTDEEGDASEEENIETDVVITDEDIDRQDPKNMRQLFSQTPEVQVTSGSTSTQRIYLNGIDQSKLNVRIDGARQKNTVWHHNGDFGVNPEFIKRVEVDGAVSPADAGPGALGGTIQFETKEADDLLLPGQIMGGMTIGSYDTNSETYRATGAAYASDGGFQLLGIINRAEGQDYTNGAGVTETGTAEDLWSGLLKGSFESSDGHKFTGTLDYFSDEGNRRLRANINHPSGFNFNLAQRQTTTFKYETTQPTEWYDPEVVFYFNSNTLERPNLNGFVIPSGAFNSYNDEFGGKIQNTVSGVWGSLTGGFDYYNNDTLIERFHFPTDVSENVSNIGGFLQARLDVTPYFEVSTGIRADFQSYEAVDGQVFDNAGVSPNISLALEVAPGTRLYGGYGYVFAGLEQAETALFHAGASGYAYDPGIDPTKSHNAKVGLSYTNGALTLDGNLFYTRMVDTVSYRYPGGPPHVWAVPAVRISGPDLVSAGYNLSARLDGPSGFISAAFNHTDIRYNERVAHPSLIYTANSVGDTLSLEGAFYVPEYDLTFGALASIAFDYQHEDLTNAGFLPLDGYEAVDLYVEWKPEPVGTTQFSLRAEVTNVFDQAYVDRGSFYATAGQVQPVLAKGRSFLVTATAKF